MRAGWRSTKNALACAEQAAIRRTHRRSRDIVQLAVSVAARPSAGAPFAFDRHRLQEFVRLSCSSRPHVARSLKQHVARTLRREAAAVLVLAALMAIAGALSPGGVGTTGVCVTLGELDRDGFILGHSRSRSMRALCALKPATTAAFSPRI